MIRWIKVGPTCPSPTSKHVCHFYDCALIRYCVPHCARPLPCKEQGHPQPQPQPSHTTKSFIVGLSRKGHIYIPISTSIGFKTDQEALRTKISSNQKKSIAFTSLIT